MSHVNDEGITVNIHVDPDETPTGGESEDKSPAPIETEKVETQASAEDIVVQPADVEGPAPSDEENDILALQAAIDSAKTPEAKAAAQKKWNYAWMKQRQENQELKERLAYLKGKAEAQAKEMQPEPTEQTQRQAALPEIQLPPKPNRSDYLDAEGYEDSDQYEAALARWGGQCAIAEEHHRAEIERVKNAQSVEQEKQKTWEQEGEKQYPGFKQKIEQVLRPMFENAPRDVSIPLSVAISESEKTHDLTMYLANNPKEVERLLSLSPVSAAREVGKLEVRLQKPKATTKSAAPAPITPVSGATPDDDTGLSDDEYFAKEKKRIAETGRYY